MILSMEKSSVAKVVSGTKSIRRNIRFFEKLATGLILG